MKSECYFLRISGGSLSASRCVLYTKKAKPYVDKMVQAVRGVDPTIRFREGRVEIKGKLEEDLVIGDIET